MDVFGGECRAEELTREEYQAAKLLSFMVSESTPIYDLILMAKTVLTIFGRERYNKILCVAKRGENVRLN